MAEHITNPNQIDWMCILRYALYGGLLFAVLFKLIFGDNSFVYLGTCIGAVVFALAKWKYLS